MKRAQRKAHAWLWSMLAVLLALAIGVSLLVRAQVQSAAERVGAEEPR